VQQLSVLYVQYNKVNFLTLTSKCLSAFFFFSVYFRSGADCYFEALKWFYVTKAIHISLCRL
jgi:hypothetical protein